MKNYQMHQLGMMQLRLGKSKEASPLPKTRFWLFKGAGKGMTHQQMQQLGMMQHRWAGHRGITSSKAFDCSGAMIYHAATEYGAAQVGQEHRGITSSKQ